MDDKRIREGEQRGLTEVLNAAGDLAAIGNLALGLRKPGSGDSGQSEPTPPPPPKIELPPGVDRE
jgi:hypothetical protein